MKFGLWIILFITFAVYTCLVYTDCDKNKTSNSMPTSQALAGWRIWQAKNCQSCHQVYGLGGFLGPDLTNTASDTAKGEKYIHTLIKYGTGKMPNFNLNDTEVNNLVAFLSWIDKSGKSRVPKERVTWSGNYNLDN